MDNEDFGYTQIIVERLKKDDNEEVVLKKRKPVVDSSLRDKDQRRDYKGYFGN